MYIGSDFPDCPPSDAVSSPGVYYRFIVTTFEEAFSSRFSLNCHDKDSCEERAISLVISEQGIEQKRKQFKVFREKPVAKVNIKDASHGVLKQDGKFHINWWHPIEFDPKSIADIVTEEPKV